MDAVEMIFRQILEGWDIPVPDAMLKLSASTAFAQLEGAPYDLATNLSHALLWQQRWLDKIEGRPVCKPVELWKLDWRQPTRAEFGAIRARFLEGLKKARELAKTETDPEKVNLLLCIAIHGAYHLGQMNLLKRMARRQPA